MPTLYQNFECSYTNLLWKNLKIWGKTDKNFKKNNSSECESRFLKLTSSGAVNIENR